MRFNKALLPLLFVPAILFAGVPYIYESGDSLTAASLNKNFESLSKQIKNNSFFENIGSDIYYMDGKVGIGTETPQASLHVLGDWDGGGAAGHGALTITGYKPTIKLEGDEYTNNSAWLIHSGNENTGDLQFFNSADGAADWGIAKVNFGIDGSVGIGVTVPASKLAVYGLPTSAPDASGNAGVVCVTNAGNFWLDNDGTADCS